MSKQRYLEYLDKEQDGSQNGNGGNGNSSPNVLINGGSVKDDEELTLNEFTQR